MQEPYTYYGLLKKADLLHKWGFVDSQMVGTVYTSKESPITHRLKAGLKLKEFLS